MKSHVFSGVAYFKSVSVGAEEASGGRGSTLGGGVACWDGTAPGQTARGIFLLRLDFLYTAYRGTDLGFY